MLVTSIGSLPFTDVEKALDAVFESCSECPFWPQLPKRSFMEDMYVQGLEGVPALVTDMQSGTTYMDTGKTEGIERFYEDVAGGNIDAFAISEAAAPGFYGFLARLRRNASGVRAIKGQLTGPFTARHRPEGRERKAHRIQRRLFRYHQAGDPHESGVDDKGDEGRLPGQGRHLLF